MPCSTRLSGLVSQRLAFTANFGAGDRGARQIGDVKFVKFFSSESHIGRAAQENCPAIPGEQAFLAGGIDAPDFIRGITTDVEIAVGVQGQAIRKTATAIGVEFSGSN